jgi:hypothetical protein
MGVIGLAPSSLPQTSHKGRRVNGGDRLRRLALVPELQEGLATWRWSSEYRRQWVFPDWG